MISLFIENVSADVTFFKSQTILLSIYFLILGATHDSFSNSTCLIALIFQSFPLLVPFLVYAQCQDSHESPSDSYAEVSIFESSNLGSFDFMNSDDILIAI